MSATDDTDGSLDPRIETELENLNNATDDINKLETELDEAHTAFRQLLSESTRRLKEVADKLGSACIEKARCYYEALEVARHAQVQCQQQARLFQRANIIHAAAKETVALAEARFLAHQHEWNFDQAWQDMLNHATIKVMDAENQKAECGREHHRRAMLFHEAERRLFQLEEKHKRSIIKARPYFEVKAHCDQMLATQKERVECLQKGLKDAKENYASSLRTLEEISNQIHQQRRDYDLVINGPREPGVGAELEGSNHSSNYQSDLNQLSNSRLSLATSSPAEKSNKLRDVSISHTTEDVEQLGKRSVDGSEATSPQWELELQAKIDNLNTSTYESYNSSRSSGLHVFDEVNAEPINLGINAQGSKFDSSHQGAQSGTSNFHKFFKSLQSLKEPLTSGSLIPHFHRLDLNRAEYDDFAHLNKIKITSRGYTSLTNSPVNTHATKFEKRTSDDVGNSLKKEFTEESCKENNFNETCSLGINNENPNTESIGTDTIDKTAKSTSGNSEDNLVRKTDVITMCTAISNMENSTVVNKRDMHSAMYKSSESRNSTPTKFASSLPLQDMKLSTNNRTTDDFRVHDNFPISNTQVSKASSIKELPLLSMFSESNALVNSGKSYSMINLNDRKDFASQHNAHLKTVQGIGAEKIANVRENLLLNVPR